MAYLSYSLGAISIFGFIACCFVWACYACLILSKPRRLPIVNG